MPGLIIRLRHKSVDAFQSLCLADCHANRFALL